MKRVGKSVFFIVVLLIFAVTITAFTGISTEYGDITTTYVRGANDIRWGTDIRGGVDVTFCPPEDYDAPENEMKQAESIIKMRLINLGITDYEVYTDFNKDRIIVRFPWKSDEKNFDPQKAIAELGETAQLTFRKGAERDNDGAPAGETLSNVVLDGVDIKEAFASVDGTKYMVVLHLNDSGKEKFSTATAEMIGQQISIWMDNKMISAPQVGTQITDGQAIISGNFTPEEATKLAEKINAGALPFKLRTENFSTLSPTLGLGAKDAMVEAGIIAFALIALLIIVLYRLPGAIATIALVGQVGLMIAAITGFFPAMRSFTLTLPGIAGIILSIGFGVDANIITAERIKEELRAGKTVQGAIESGFSRAFTAIFDGNVTVVFVAIILMGAFGPTNSFFGKLLSPIFMWFGPSTAGSIYSFGFTLLVGVILNLVMGVLCSRLMITSLAKFDAFKNPVLYGGAKNENV
ncbi:MAG: SecD/SecF family protein translocase subunit [Oscillospiraceae bacterium]